MPTPTNSFVTVSAFVAGPVTIAALVAGVSQLGPQFLDVLDPAGAERYPDAVDRLERAFGMDRRRIEHDALRLHGERRKDLRDPMRQVLQCPSQKRPG